MQIKLQQLSGALQAKLLPVYLLSGEEPQQILEAGDTIKRAARAQGYLAREVFFADKSFDWKQLNESADNFSIFADKKIIDLKLASDKPGDGAKALAAYCKRPPDDTLLLVTAGKIGKEAQKSAWFQAIDKAGCILQVWPLTGHDLISWLQARMQQRGLSAEPEVIKLLADRVEGNLLAAAQEIEKLYVLYGASKLRKQHIIDAVSDNSRFDVFKLVESALSAQVNKALKIQASLKAEGIAPSIVLWALSRETRVLVGLKAAQGPAEKDLILKKNGVWGERKQVLDSALKRLSHDELNRILMLGAKTDRQIKGQQQGDAWETLLEMSLALASASMSVC